LPINSLTKYFDRNKFLAQCLVDNQLSTEFGFFKLDKKCLKTLIRMWANTGDGLASKLPIEIIKYLNIDDFFIYYRFAPSSQKESIINEYKKYNKCKISFEKLFKTAKQSDLLSDNTEWILFSVDSLVTFAEKFNIKVKPIINHPYDDWHINEYELDNFANSDKYKKNDKKRIIRNFKKFFKKWYWNETGGYKRFLIGENK
jgi:hypothetical protein